MLLKLRDHSDKKWLDKIRNHMTEKKKEYTASCELCGRCCSMEIPLTLLDIHRMAEFRGADESRMFEDVVQKEISSRTSLFMIRKKRDGTCVFLDEEKRCSIHPVKPNPCRFYSCSLQKGQMDLIPWTATCTDPSQRGELWEESVAVLITKAYIEKNGSEWNETDYRAALKSLFDHILIRDTQKLKLSRDKEGRPLAMIYDCSRCEKRGTWAEETPITLDDVRRISAGLGISWKVFFNRYVSPETSCETGGLKLKRNGHCVFFHPEEECRVKEVRPSHCRFRPCPKRTHTSEMMDALFLGSGIIEDQFRHQVSLAVTREYVEVCGTRYRKHEMVKSIARMDKLAASSPELRKFCKQIAPFRYVDDTLKIRNP